MARLSGDPTGSRIDRALILTGTTFDATIPTRPRVTRKWDHFLASPASTTPFLVQRAIDRLWRQRRRHYLRRSWQRSSLRRNQTAHLRGPGSKRLVGGTGVDTLRGGQANRWIEGRCSADWLVGDAGDGFFRAGDQSGTIFADTATTSSMVKTASTRCRSPATAKSCERRILGRDRGHAHRRRDKFKLPLDRPATSFDGLRTGQDELVSVGLWS